MKWIIVFYQIIMTLPEGEIIFSGLDLGNKFIKTKSILAESYLSQNECEKKLAKFKGKNKISEVDTFYSKNAKIVTDYEPLINNQRVVVNAFQCLQIK